MKTGKEEPAGNDPIPFTIRKINQEMPDVGGDKETPDQGPDDDDPNEGDDENDNEESDEPPAPTIEKK